MTRTSQVFASLLLLGLLTAGAVAQTSGAARFDSAIQQKVSQQLQEMKEFRNVQASVEDGIVTLTGSVELYQQKLDAAKKIRKSANVQGVRNLLAVSSSAPDEQLAAQLQRKVYYDRMGYYDNRYNYVAVSVEDGVATLSGATRSYIGRDSAMFIASTMPGVKDVVNNISVLPTSIYDDDIRIRATRAIYRDSALSRYAIDPAAPIRIVVDNGKLSLYGTVQNTMDKQIAGIRAGEVFGVFKVENNLVVAKRG